MVSPSGTARECSDNSVFGTKVAGSLDSAERKRKRIRCLLPRKNTRMLDDLFQEVSNCATSFGNDRRLEDSAESFPILDLP